MHNNRYLQARRITLIGVVVNVFLAILKVVFGVLGNSHALMADGVHSFSDLLTDIVVLLASRYGSEEADRNHPYGHGRIETAATVALSLLLIGVGFGIIVDAGSHLMGGVSAEEIGASVLIIAAISVVANEALFRYTLKVAEQIRSNLLRANAWHSRTDAASSIVVLVGVAGSLMGFPFLDSFAAMIVGVFIVKMGWGLGWSSIKELVDTGLDEAMLSRIEEIISEVKGVESIHQLRTRSVGGNVFVDVHVMVDARLSVSEGHYIGDRVHVALKNDTDDIVDVTVHIDPEDDEVEEPSDGLPSREELMALLRLRWEGLPGVDSMDDFIIHYLAGKIHLELRLPLTVLNETVKSEDLQRRFQDALEDLRHISSVKLFFN